MIRSYETVRIKRFKNGEYDIIRISETSIDIKEQICNVKYTIYQTRLDGTFKFMEETQRNRFFLIQEMNGIAEECGFEVINNYSGFNATKSINEETWHVVSLVKKVASVV